jgi:hypothetical protein
MIQEKKGLLSYWTGVGYGSCSILASMACEEFTVDLGIPKVDECDRPFLMVLVPALSPWWQPESLNVLG